MKIGRAVPNIWSRTDKRTHTHMQTHADKQTDKQTDRYAHHNTPLSPVVGGVINTSICRNCSEAWGKGARLRVPSDDRNVRVRRLTTLISSIIPFIPGSKPFFSANPSHRYLPFLLQDWLHRFPRLMFTDTSEHIRFYFLVLFFHFLFSVPCSRLSLGLWQLSSAR